MGTEHYRHIDKVEFNVIEPSIRKLLKAYNQPNQKEEKMHKKFKAQSQKVIEVEPRIFELVANHELRAIHVPSAVAEKLDEFIICTQDAAIVVKKENDYTSELKTELSVVEFDLV